MITWTITQLERDAANSGVLTAHWRVTKTEDGDTTGTYGTCSLTPDPDASGFIPFADLDEATVLSWVHANSVDKDEIEANLAIQMEAIKNPPVISGVPW